MGGRRLPPYLFAAHEHTEAGGELELLERLDGVELTSYARDSAANSDETVSEDDIVDLAEWLRGGIGRTS